MVPGPPGSPSPFLLDPVTGLGFLLALRAARSLANPKLRPLAVAAVAAASTLP